MTWLSNKHLTKYVALLFAILVAPAADAGAGTGPPDGVADAGRRDHSRDRAAARPLRSRRRALPPDHGAAGRGALGSGRWRDRRAAGPAAASAMSWRSAIATAAIRRNSAELRDWLARYGADLPASHAIHALALRRRQPEPVAPPKPEGAPVRPARHRRRSRRFAPARPCRIVRGGGRREARHPSAVRASNRRRAEQRLQDADSLHLLADADYDEARADVAEGYLFIGESQKGCLLLAATARTTAFRPLAHWDAGLAAWRLGRLGEARTHFETLARMPGLSRWNLSAGRPSGRRASTRANHRLDLVAYWLGLAAENPRSFYGLLARRMRGHDSAFDFEPEIFTAVDLDALAPSSRRPAAFLALLQIDASARRRARAAHPCQRRARRPLPGARRPRRSRQHAGAQPCNSPRCSPRSTDGATITRSIRCRAGSRPTASPSTALSSSRLFARSRNSCPDAQSSAGAVGLMQLMPATAQALRRAAAPSLRAPGALGR